MPVAGTSLEKDQHSLNKTQLISTTHTLPPIATQTQWSQIKLDQVRVNRRKRETQEVK